ncbi:MAG: hypothetical protein ACK5IJ_08945 [Mangrovibacterium sp.]
MHMRKPLVIITISLLIICTALWLFISRQSKSFAEHSALKAISQRAALVIEIPDIENFLETLSNKSDFMTQFREVSYLSSFHSRTSWLNTHLLSNEALMDLLEDKTILISYNHQGKDAIVPLYCFNFDRASEINPTLKGLKNYAQENGYKYESFDYDQHDVFYIDFPTAGAHYYACHEGIFMMSQSKILIEEGIRQINASNLMTDQSFQEIYSTVSSSSLLNVFVNHAQIAPLLNQLINPNYRSSIQDISSFASWSEYDVTNKSNEFWINGYSSISKQNDQYLSSLNKQKPQRFRMSEVISSNASFFINLNLEDFNQFQEDYSSYLKNESKNYYTRETRLLNIEKQIKVNLTSKFNRFSDHDYAVVYGNIVQKQPEANRYFIVKTKSKSIAEDELLPIIQDYADKNGRTIAELKSTYTLDEKESYDIYQFPISDFSGVLFGQAFASVACNYLCFYDNYLIFSDSDTSLKSYIHDLVLRSTLDNDENFSEFNREMSSNSNFYAYLNFSKFFLAHEQFLSPTPSKVVASNEESIRKIQAIGWQISRVDDKFMNNIYVNYNPHLKEDPQALWASQLESNINIKPQMVHNHTEPGTKEVIVQDNANNLYLINKEGVQVWKVKLSGKIIGSIHQIDLFSNKRLQYVFNTSDKLFILDRNGNNVGKFPITLRSPATNGVSVFDYDKNGKYRFFLACENKQTYAYDTNGNIVVGWNGSKTDAVVTNPIQHRQINNKDYIIYTDLHNSYILSRSGEARNKNMERFEHSNNDIYFINTEGRSAIATTDTKGIIHMQFLEGESKTVKFANFGSDHKFVAGDLNNDGYDDFIFAAKNTLVVFDSNGKQFFEQKFDGNISNTPTIFTFSKNDIRIGVTIASKNQIHLFTTDGKECNGFPLQGNTDFSIGRFSSTQGHFNILVGNNTGFLNYMI